VNSATQVTTAEAVKITDNSMFSILRDTGMPQFDTGGVLSTNKEKYISKDFRFQEPLELVGTPATYSVQFNGATLPAYKMSRSEFYNITKNSVDSYKVEKEMSFQQYIDSYFVQCLQFNLKDSDMTRLASGVDSRAVSSNMALETEGLNSCHLDIFVETTAELRVGSGRSIEVIA